LFSTCYEISALVSLVLIEGVFIGILKDGQNLVSHEPTNNYRHNLTSEDNAASHLKPHVIARQVLIAITKGKPNFGFGTSILLRIRRWPKQEGPRKSAWRVSILFKRRIVIWFSSALQHIQLVLIYVC
jgi:hypothetical protein